MSVENNSKIEIFFKLWNDRIQLGKDDNPLKKTLEILDLDFKWLNTLKFTNKEFGKRFTEIENKLISDEHDEMNEYLTELYLDYKKDGLDDSDIEEIFGKNFSLDKLLSSKPQVKKIGNSFYEKYTIKYNPKSKDPVERLMYNEEYKQRLLDKKKRDQERSIESRLKRKEKIDKLRSKYSDQGFDQFDTDKDWREERLIQSVEKKIKKLNDQIKKNKKLNELRVIKQKELQEEKVKKNKEIEKQRIQRLKDIQKEKDKKNKLVEHERLKRIREREKLQKERVVKRKKREELRRTSKFRSKILIEEVKDSLNKVEIPKDIKDLVKYSDRYQKKLYDVSGKIVFKWCGNCGTHKNNLHFYTNGKDENGKHKLSTYCISCTRIKKGLDPGSGRRGEFYKGEQRFKVNEKGNKVEIKCTSCTEFKKVKEFNYLYRKSSVCKDCYVQRENNVLTRKGEFRIVGGKRKQFRVYDEKTFMVLEKRCNDCGEMKELDQFNRNSNNNIDGRVGRCKPCSDNKRNSSGVKSPPQSKFNRRRVSSRKSK